MRAKTIAKPPEQSGRADKPKAALLEPPVSLWMKVSRGALLVALVALGQSLWRACLLPALGTDGLIYHLTVPVMWIQRGLFSQLDLPFHDSAAEHSPMLTQSISYLLMRLTGDDGLCWLIPPIFLVATFRLFFLSARLLGLRRETALLWSSVLVLFPPFFASAPMPNNDLALTCGCALFLYGLLRTRPAKGAPVALAAGGIALMLATKVVGLVYAAAAMVVLLPAAWSRFRQAGQAPRRKLLAEAAAAVVLVLAGSFFYLRNWFVHGNPLYPAEIGIGGVTLFAGLYDSSVLIDHGWSLSAFGKVLFHEGDPGVAFAFRLPFGGLLWLGFLASATLLLARFRSRASWPVLAATVVFPLLSIALYFAVTPFWRQHRLLFPVYYALWLAAASGLALIEALGRRLPAVVLSCLLAGFLFVQLYMMGFWDHGESWALAIAAGLVGCIRWPRQAFRRVLAPVAGLALVLAAATAWWWYPAYRARRHPVREHLYARYYGPQGEAWNAVERLSRAGRPLTVAYAGTPLTFPLFGSRLANRVVYVPISGEDKPTPVSLKRGDSIYLRLARQRRASADDQFWLDGLRRERVDLICLVNDPNRGGAEPELGMIIRHPDMFEPVFSQEGVHLFRVLGR